MADVKVTLPRNDYNPNQRTDIDVEVVNGDGSVSTRTVKGAVQSITQEDGRVTFGILASAHVPFGGGGGGDAAYLYAEGARRGSHNLQPYGVTTSGTSFTSDFTPAVSGKLQTVMWVARNATYSLEIDGVSKGSQSGSTDYDFLTWDNLDITLTASTPVELKLIRSSGSGNAFSGTASKTFSDGGTLGDWQELSPGETALLVLGIEGPGWALTGVGSGSTSDSVAAFGSSTSEGITSTSLSGGSYPFFSFEIWAADSAPVKLTGIKWDAGAAKEFECWLDGESLGTQTAASAGDELTWTLPSAIVLGTVRHSVVFRTTDGTPQKGRFASGGAFTGTHVNIGVWEQANVRPPVRLVFEPEA